MTVDEAIFHCEKEVEKQQKELSYHQDHFRIEYFDSCKKCISDLKQLAEWLKELKEFHKSFGIDDIGDFSDGYHTFNQLYHQRAVLFATIVNLNKDKAWKSFKHSDGKYCFNSNGEWFIVGVDTPKGSYTYHYSKEYWNMFDCEELECAKEWDGHTEEDVIRLLSLKQKSCEDLIEEIDKLPRIKVGNSNSPSVQYCINENLIYELLDRLRENEEKE